MRSGACVRAKRKPIFSGTSEDACARAKERLNSVAQARTLALGLQGSLDLAAQARTLAPGRIYRIKQSQGSLNLAAQARTLAPGLGVVPVVLYAKDNFHNVNLHINFLRIVRKVLSTGSKPKQPYQ